MKKSLIALAVLATAGTAFAQSTVTLSGKFAAAYTDGTTTTTTAGVAAPGVDVNGLGVTDGNVTFAAVEDLGGGMKAGVSMDVRVRGRGAAGVVDGRNGTVFVGGGFGTVTIGAIEAANGINPLGGAGAPVQGLDDTTAGAVPGVANAAVAANLGTPLSRAGNVDAMIYNTPKMSGFTGTFMLIDSIGAPGANGMEDAAATQDATLIGLAYAAGPLAASADYTNYGANGKALATAYRTDSRVRMSASYDLGVAKLGAGYQTTTSKELNLGVATGAADLKIKEYILGVSAPMGAFVLGANYTNRKADDIVAMFAGHKTTGWDLGAQYNLSKRTAVQASYRTIKAEVNGGNSVENKNLRVRLMHSF